MNSEIDGNGEAGSRAEAPAAREPAGAQPSITAPANCISVLRHGIDSLYVSFPGQIAPHIAVKLQELKEFSQNSSEHVIAQGRFHLGEHLFTVLPRGRGRFAYVIEDNWFSIQISNAVSLPLAYVQIRSEYLTAVGAEEAIETLARLVKRLGKVSDEPTISRIDLFADFTSECDLTKEPGFAWIKRCKKRDVHEENDKITGISFGPGNELSARLYDKTLEITKSHKDYFKPLWAAHGWREGQTVWRMEFQARREAFAFALKGPAVEVLPHLGAWWRYLATEWLRLGIPSESDETRARWLTHPVWQAIADVFEVPPDAPLMTRVTKDRAPTDDILFKNGLWGLSSFMARQGLSGYSHGIGEYLHALEEYFAKEDFEGLDAYLNRKARLKARRYNTRKRDDEKD